MFKFITEITHPRETNEINGVHTFLVGQSNHNKKYYALADKFGSSADIYDTPEEAIDSLIKAQACTRISEIKELKEENGLTKTKTLPRFTLCKFGSVLDYALHEYGMHMVDDVRVWTFANSGDAYDMTQCDDDLKTGDVLLIPSEKVVGITNTWPLAITKEIGHLHGVEDGYKIEDLLPSDTDKDYVNKALKVARSLAKSYDI